MADQRRMACRLRLRNYAVFLYSINRIVKNLTSPPPPLRAGKIIDQLRERIRYLHDSLRAEEAYVYWVRDARRRSGQALGCCEAWLWPCPERRAPWAFAGRWRERAAGRGSAGSGAAVDYAAFVGQAVGWRGRPCTGGAIGVRFE